jgi:hypothetical protein
MNKITIKQMSDRTGISVPTLRRWCVTGRIDGAEQTQFKIGAGNIWLIPENAIIPIPDEVGKRSPNYELSPKN